MDVEDAMIWGIGAMALLFIGLLSFGVPLFISLGLGVLAGIGATVFTYKRSHRPGLVLERRETSPRRRRRIAERPETETREPEEAEGERDLTNS